MLELVAELDRHGVRHWLDGGWGVDALLGEQTRRHSDLDLVVSRPALERVGDLLRSRGHDVIRDWRPTSVAFRDAHGREVDLHPVDLTADGGGDQQLAGGHSWHYSPPVTGSIAGEPVPCAPVEDQLAMHLGYDLRPVDVDDLQHLAEKYGLTLPGPLADDGSE